MSVKPYMTPDYQQHDMLEIRLVIVYQGCPVKQHKHTDKTHTDTDTHTFVLIDKYHTKLK